MARNFYNKLRSRLSALYGLSIYGALLLVVFGGLVIPAIIGSYLLIGVHEQKSAQTALNESLQRNADILALGMQESLWNMNAESAHSLVESVMRDRSVLQVQVTGHLHLQYGAVAHYGFDQRMGRFRVHVPQGFLHAEGQDVSVALQRFVEGGLGGFLFVHPDQQVRADNGWNHQAAEYHQ